LFKTDTHKTALSKFYHPWIITYVKLLTRKIQRAYNLAKQINHSENWSTYFEIKRLIQQECRKAFNNYISNFIDSENNCTKRCFIKSRWLDQTGISPINYMGETHTNSLSKADAFADYFLSVYTQDNPSNIPTLEGKPFPIHPIHPIYIHPERVSQLLPKGHPMPNHRRIVRSPLRF